MPRNEWRATGKETINLRSIHASIGSLVPVPLLLKAKWMFNVKYNSDRTLQRLTGSLLAKGFTQVPASDFYGTYSAGFSYASFPRRYGISGGEQPTTGSVGFEEQASLSSRSMWCLDMNAQLIPEGCA